MDSGKSKRPRMQGNKYPVGVYLEPDVFEKVEEMRGRVSRSAFIEDIIIEVTQKSSKSAC